METCNLKLSTENCGPAAADGDIVTIDKTAYSKSPAPYPIVPLPTPYELSFGTGNNTT